MVLAEQFELVVFIYVCFVHNGYFWRRGAEGSSLVFLLNDGTLVYLHHQ